MNAAFVTTKQGTRAYIQQKVRVSGHSTTRTVERLGLLEEIQRKHGCEDPRRWVAERAARLTLEARQGRELVSVEFLTDEEISKEERPLRHGGDLALLGLYRRLGLDAKCREIASAGRTRYDLAEVLRTLVMGRILFPGSKSATYERAQSMVRPPKFAPEDMYRGLSLLAGHIDEIQAEVYARSKDVVGRRERVVYYDCTNYYFAVEDNDRDAVDEATGEVHVGLRKRGKSKEHRPDPIVQMGMFMDMDGIPLAFVIFPGNESEQGSLQPLQQKLNRDFGMTEYVVSTDAGLASEGNRRYNMAEGRDYICVQSLPSLPKGDRKMAIAPEGWRVAFRTAKKADGDKATAPLGDGPLNLDELRKRLNDEPGLLDGVTLMKEILVDKRIRVDNPEWLRQARENPDEKPGVPRQLTDVRRERVIVTYSHDYARYLARKRTERLAAAQAIVRSGQAAPRADRQSARNYVKTVYKTDEGDVALHAELSIDDEILRQEEALDGFYAYGTSLDDDAVDVLRIRSFHREIEHLFRTTKTHLEARPVYLSRPDRIRSHFLTCFLSMVLLKILQRQLIEANPGAYNDEKPLTIDALIGAIRSLNFTLLPGRNYTPAFRRTDLTDQLQDLAGVNLNTRIILEHKMSAAYRKVNKP